MALKVILTGCAGFIGMHVAEELLKRGEFVFGIDNLNDYYDVRLKRLRLSRLERYKNFSYSNGDICNAELVKEAFSLCKPQKVINLAAQPGVRHSLNFPRAYIDSNVVGFFNVLEACRQHKVDRLVYASSSSVYGANKDLPFATNQRTDAPISLYAATKKSNELMAHAYSHLYGFSAIGLRYFTVYGPWGRPDMSPWLFTESIIKGVPINIFNHGRMRRDFTFIDDAVDGTLLAFDGQHLEAAPSFSESSAARVYNIGNQYQVELMDFVDALESGLGVKAIKNYVDMQPGDVLETFADISDASRDFGYFPKVKLSEGVENWVSWYRGHQGPAASGGLV